MDSRTAFGSLSGTVAAGGIAALIGATALPSKSDYLHLLVYAGAAATLVGLIGLCLLLIIPVPPAPLLPTAGIDQRVTSHGQLGGITAHTVLARPERRTIASKSGMEIIRALEAWPKKGSWQVGSQSGDSEAYSFAEDVREHMVSQGFRVCDTICSLMLSQPLIGYAIRPPATDGIDTVRCWVQIGQNPEN